MRVFGLLKFARIRAKPQNSRQANAETMARNLAVGRYQAKTVSARASNKLAVRQVATLTEPNVYSDGGGLYLRVRTSGRSWFFIGTLEGKRIELGLGSALLSRQSRGR